MFKLMDKKIIAILRKLFLLNSSFVCTYCIEEHASIQSPKAQSPKAKTCLTHQAFNSGYTKPLTTATCENNHPAQSRLTLSCMQYVKKSLVSMSLVLFLFDVIHLGCDGVFCLFDLILYVPSTIFQLYRDGSSWVEPVLS